MAQRNSGGALVAGLIPALILTLVFSIILLGGSDEDTMCLPGSQQPGVTIDPESVPDTPIAGYEHEQLVNAAYIMQAGKALGLSVRDQTIGVMTAMGVVDSQPGVTTPPASGLMLTCTWSKWFWVSEPRSAIGRQPSSARSADQICCHQMM